MFGSGDPFQQQQFGGPLGAPDEYVSPYQAGLAMPPGGLSAEVANVVGPIYAQKRMQLQAPGPVYQQPYSGPRPTGGEVLGAGADVVVAVVQLAVAIVTLPIRLVRKSSSV